MDTFWNLVCGAAIGLCALALSACGDRPGAPLAGLPLGNPSVPDPLVSGPIGDAGIRGHALWDSWFDLTELGYLEEEYFVAGAARAFPAGEPAAYTTRIIVRRPADPADFNGVVVLDWVNVTAQFENAVQTLEAHQLFHRDGYAYVHVSAQAAGLCCTPLTPQVWDPVRYAELSHPGDAYAFDIFSQIAQALRAPVGIDPMGGLPVAHVIAMGQSQSASRLYSYVSEVHARDRVIDAFLIQSGGGKVYAEPPEVPVIHLLSDAEASPEEPTLHPNYRLWEVAGSAHQDLWVGYHQELGQAGRVTVDAPRQPASADEDLHQLTANYGEQPDPGLGVCIAAGTAFPMRFAVMAGLHQLRRWVSAGVPARQPPRYEFDARGMLARDDLGNARGGLRYPPIDVPVARYQSDLCGLGGMTIPLTEVELIQRYPTHADYYCQMQEATRRSVEQGDLLPPDAQGLMARVAAAANRWVLPGGVLCEEIDFD